MPFPCSCSFAVQRLVMKVVEMRDLTGLQNTWAQILRVCVVVLVNTDTSQCRDSPNVPHAGPGRTGSTLLSSTALCPLLSLQVYTTSYFSCRTRARGNQPPSKVLFKASALSVPISGGVTQMMIDKHQKQLPFIIAGLGSWHSLLGLLRLCFPAVGSTAAPRRRLICGEASAA